jgi:hypothetical protein
MNRNERTKEDEKRRSKRTISGPPLNICLIDHIFQFASLWLSKA